MGDNQLEYSHFDIILPRNKVTTMKLAKRLTDLRENKDLSKLKLAKILDIPRTTYYNYESGVAQPKIETLLKIANYYGVSVDYLIGNDRDTTKIELPSEISNLQDAMNFLSNHNLIAFVKNKKEDNIIEIARIILYSLKK